MHSQKVLATPHHRLLYLQRGIGNMKISCAHARFAKKERIPCTQAVLLTRPCGCTERTLIIALCACCMPSACLFLTSSLRSNFLFLILPLSQSMRAVSDCHCSKPSRHDGALSCSRYKNEPFFPVWLWLTLHVDPLPSVSLNSMSVRHTHISKQSHKHKRLKYTKTQYHGCKQLLFSI